MLEGVPISFRFELKHLYGNENNHKTDELLFSLKSSNTPIIILVYAVLDTKWIYFYQVRLPLVGNIKYFRNVPLENSISEC